MKGKKGPTAGWFYEDYLGRREGRFIAGTDEVGRGAWAFDLTCACCVFHPKVELPFQLRDSKKYNDQERERLVEVFTRDYIEKGLLHVTYARIDAATIEKGNLNDLNRQAFCMAFEELQKIAHFDKVIIDGDMNCDDLPWTGMTLVKGDEKSITVATASIFAKVHRDRQMRELHKQYPQYDFASHVGYGTEKHKEAILRYGPIPGLHRSNFLQNLRRDGLLK